MNKKEKATIRELASILAGEKDLSNIEQLLAAKTITHFDDLLHANTTPEYWRSWVQFLRERGRVSNPSGICDDIVVNPDETITLIGRWTGERKGKPLISETATVSYRLEDGLVADIWTKRTNYVFFFRIIGYKIGFMVILAYFFFWRRFLQKEPHPLAAPLQKETL